MKSESYILAIDQGTSGTKVLIFDQQGQIMSKATAPLKTFFRKGGLVEQDPEEIYQNVLQAVRECLKIFRSKGLEINKISTCGISNQRETFLLWDKSGKPLCNAIVWQCKRSIDICRRLINAGMEPSVKKKTGLIIDPYFSGTKLIWLKENEIRINEALERGEAYFGTVDTWLLYRLTKGMKYLTDHTNASRTMFFNLQSLNWDGDLLGEFGLSGLNLPETRASSSYFGASDFEGIFDMEISITAMIGDSHAAAFGEECFSPGTAKATLGTGCSVLMNIGGEPKDSGNGMVTTICWSTEERVDYALEGVIVSCGATIEWLKNEIGIIGNSNETEQIALSLKNNNGVYLVPAFSGLGAPHWQMDRKASIVGLTFDCNKNHIVRAALEAIPYQIKDVIRAMETDSGIDLRELNIDGGIRNNQFVIRFLADLLEKPVNCLGISDVSALGAANLAGLGSGLYSDLKQLKGLQERKTIDPAQVSTSHEAYKGWLRAVEGTSG